MKKNRPIRVTEQERNMTPEQWKRKLRVGLTGAAVVSMFITSVVWILIIAFAMMAA